MKIGGHTKWLLLTEIKNTNLMGIFSREGPEGFTLGRSKWKSLIEGSSMHNSCTTPKEGFNVHASNGADGAKARIGLIGYKDCEGEPMSRIGFGTEGSSGGMDTSNTCGNEATASADNGNKTIKAFCYILLK